MNQSQKDVLVLVREYKKLFPNLPTRWEFSYNGGGDDGDWDDIPDFDDIEALEKMQEALFEMVSDIQGDWYNNDGGGGSITIVWATGEVEWSYYYNVMTTDDHRKYFGLDQLED